MRKYLILLASFIFLLDRLTKWLVMQKIPLYREVEVIPGVFRLTHLENTGAAFSLFADIPGPWPGRLLVLFSLAALAVITYLLWKLGESLNILTLSLALFLGGTLGNLWDRLLQGRVTDFLDFYIGPHHWPPFNVADSAIVVGALMLAGQVLMAPAKRSAPRKNHDQTRRGQPLG
jgi:signal peptidase II